MKETEYFKWLRDINESFAIPKYRLLVNPQSCIGNGCSYDGYYEAKMKQFEDKIKHFQKKIAKTLEKGIVLHRVSVGLSKIAGWKFPENYEEDVFVIELFWRIINWEFYEILENHELTIWGELKKRKY